MKRKRGNRLWQSATTNVHYRMTYGGPLTELLVDPKTWTLLRQVSTPSKVPPVEQRCTVTRISRPSWQGNKLARTCKSLRVPLAETRTRTVFLKKEQRAKETDSRYNFAFITKVIKIKFDSFHFSSCLDGIIYQLCE